MSCLKKVSLSVAALTVTAAIFAGTDMDSRVRELEKQMKQVRTETAAKTFGANTALTHLDSQNQHFFLAFDVLYAQARVGGSEFCYTEGGTTTPADPILPVVGIVHDADFKWDWGFRASAGYNFQHGGWEGLVEYTYYDAPAYNLVTGGPDGGVIAIRGMDAIVDTAESGYDSDFVAAKGTSQYKFNFNRGDIELARNFFVADYLSLRPYMGLVTAWINLRQALVYSGGSLLGNTVSVTDTNNFWGIGPKVGLDTKWYLSQGFSFFADAEAGLVYGRYRVKHVEQFSLDPSDDYVRLSGNMHGFSPMAQIELGVAYDVELCEDTQHLCISLGWDIQYWWRVNQMLYTYEDQHSLTRLAQDANLQGVTLHVRWDF